MVVPMVARKDGRWADSSVVLKGGQLVLCLAVQRAETMADNWAVCSVVPMADSLVGLMVASLVGLMVAQMVEKMVVYWDKMMVVPMAGKRADR